MKRYFLSLIIIMSLLSCSSNDDDDEIIVRIASYTTEWIDPVSGNMQKRLLVKYEESDDWQPLTEPINGFEYKEGYEYVLRIKVETLKNPPMDGSSIKLSLVEIISKKRND